LETVLLLIGDCAAAPLVGCCAADLVGDCDVLLWWAVVLGAEWAA